VDVMGNTDGALPFSRFKLDIGFMKPKVILKFLQKHCSEIRELYIVDRYNLIQITRNSQVLMSYQKETLIAYPHILTIVLTQAPNLKVLGLVVSMAELPLLSETTTSLLHLQKLDFKLTNDFEPVQTGRFFKEMIRLSPALKEFFIGSNSRPGEVNPFVQFLPKWLEMLPEHIHLGLYFDVLNDSMQQTLQTITTSGILLVFLSVFDIKFVDLAVKEYFWNWLTIHPLRHIVIKLTSAGVEQAVLQNCERLSTSTSSMLFGGNLELSFPIVRRLTLDFVHDDEVFRIAAKLPRLEHLYCKELYDPWHTLTGYTSDEVIETFSGLDVKARERSSPLLEMKGELNKFTMASSK